MPDPATPDPAATPEPPKPAEPQPQGDPAGAPLGENGEKALKAERDARKALEKEKSALQKQVDEIQAAQMSDLEKAQKQAKEAQETAAKATAEALRFRVAAKHSITDEDAELFLTGTDEATLERQAARLAEHAGPSTPTVPKPDLSQGGKPSSGATSPEQAFASTLQNLMGQ